MNPGFPGHDSADNPEESTCTQNVPVLQACK